MRRRIPSAGRSQEAYDRLSAGESGASIPSRHNEPLGCSRARLIAISLARPAREIACTRLIFSRQRGRHLAPVEWHLFNGAARELNSIISLRLLYISLAHEVAQLSRCPSLISAPNTIFASSQFRTDQWPVRMCQNCSTLIWVASRLECATDMIEFHIAMTSQRIQGCPSLDPPAERSPTGARSNNYWPPPPPPLDYKRAGHACRVARQTTIASKRCQFGPKFKCLAGPRMRIHR